MVTLEDFFPWTTKQVLQLCRSAGLTHSYVAGGCHGQGQDRHRSSPTCISLSQRTTLLPSQAGVVPSASNPSPSLPNT